MPGAPIRPVAPIGFRVASRTPTRRAIYRAAALPRIQLANRQPLAVEGQRPGGLTGRVAPGWISAQLLNGLDDVRERVIIGMRASPEDWTV